MKEHQDFVGNTLPDAYCLGNQEEDVIVYPAAVVDIHAGPEVSSELDGRAISSWVVEISQSLGDEYV